MNRDPSPAETKQPEPREVGPIGVEGHPTARSATGREPLDEARSDTGQVVNLASEFRGGRPTANRRG